jgi:hypothetical protein
LLTLSFGGAKIKSGRNGAIFMPDSTCAARMTIMQAGQVKVEFEYFFFKGSKVLRRFLPT